MPTVFISHSNQDRDSTRFVVDSLRRAGFDVWVDFENIPGGADWLCEIQAGISRCAAMVTILSTASAQSVWVERECLYAFQLRKPVFTALISDVLIPLHLINIQYCDLRRDPAAGMAKLVGSLEPALNASEQPLDESSPPQSTGPNEANFFPYVEQLPNGDIATLVAQDLFHWARTVADEVAFGGKVQPGFHLRVKPSDRMVTVLSIWAYRQTPSAQLPLDYLSAHKPYDCLESRQTIVRKLNRLLADSTRIPMTKADRRPTFPLRCLSDAGKLESFKAIVGEMVNNLRAAKTKD